MIVIAHREPPTTKRRVPTGRTEISGPSTRTVWFVCWSVRSTTVRDLRLVVATVSLYEPLTVIRTGSGHPGQCYLSVDLVGESSNDFNPVLGERAALSCPMSSCSGRVFKLSMISAGTGGG